MVNEVAECGQGDQVASYRLHVAGNMLQVARKRPMKRFEICSDSYRDVDGNLEFTIGFASFKQSVG